MKYFNEDNIIFYMDEAMYQPDIIKMRDKKKKKIKKRMKEFFLSENCDEDIYNKIVEDDINIDLEYAKEVGEELIYTLCERGRVMFDDEESKNKTDIIKIILNCEDDEEWLGELKDKIAEMCKGHRRDEEEWWI